MEDFYAVIGKDSDIITWWQMGIRALLVFFITLLMIRLGATRVFGRNSAFDIVLGIILGSILSRAITGNSPFVPTVLAAIFLTGLHMGLASLAFSNSRLGWLIKGREKKLLENGAVKNEAMKACKITMNDLEEAVRHKGGDKIEQVKYAYLERSGDISVILEEKSTKRSTSD